MTTIDSKINGPNGVSPKKADATAKKPKAEAASEGSASTAARVKKGDRVQVSSAQGDIGPIKEAYSGVAEIRAERVSSLRDEVEAGTYHRDSSDIADKIVKDVIAHS